MKPSASMAATCSRALETYAENPGLREFVESWMVRFARTADKPKTWATTQRVHSWFSENAGFRGRPGFFGAEVTAERLAWDMLGGDHGERETAEAVAKGAPEEGSVLAMVERLEVEADEREAALVAAGGDLSTLTTVEDWVSEDRYREMGERRPEWGGVIVVEGMMTDDLRLIRPGALSHRLLPIPLRSQPQDIGGHDGALTVGAITQLERSTPAAILERTGIEMPADAVPIWGAGLFDVGEDAQRSRQQIQDGMRIGNSVDLVDVRIEMPDDPAEIEAVMMGEAPLVIASGQIAGTTQVDVAAFGLARLAILGDVPQPGELDVEALVASGGLLEGVRLRVVSSFPTFTAEPPEPVRWVAISEMPSGWLPSPDGFHEIDDEMAAEEFRDATGVEVVDLGDGVAYSTEPLVASAGGVRPPSDWFAQQDYQGPTPWDITENDPDGLRRISGHVAFHGSCHISFPGQCTDLPSGLDYSSFQGDQVPGRVRCSDGETVLAGPIVMSTDHAAVRDRSGRPVPAGAAIDHYAHTGALIAQVRCYEDRWGLAVEGWVLPSVTDEQLAVLDAADLSPDWRPRATAAGGYGVVAILAVPVSGFNLGLAASGGPTGDAEVAVGRSDAVRRAEALTALGLPVPAELAAVAGSGLHPVMRRRAEAALAVLTGQLACGCGCGGACSS